MSPRNHGKDQKNMRMLIDENQDPIVVTLQGNLIGENSQQVRLGLAPLVARPRQRVLVDLRQVEYLDSHGFAVLVHVASLASMHESRVVFMEPSAAVREVLHATRLDLYLSVQDTRAAALAHLEG